LSQKNTCQNIFQQYKASSYGNKKHTHDLRDIQNMNGELISGR